MILLNNAMYQIFIPEQWKKSRLQAELQAILNSDFIIVEGCHFLASLRGENRHHIRKDYIDDTGFEGFLNAFHTDDYISDDFLAQSYLFVKQLFIKWNDSNPQNPLKAIIGQTETGTHVRFHVFRKNEQYIDEDTIDLFEEALLIITSTAVNFM